MGSAAIIATSICAIAIAFAYEVARAKRRIGKLDEIAAAIAGQSDGSGATGKHRDLVVHYVFEGRGEGSDRELWTAVAVRLPHRYPLALHVRRQIRADRGPIARGEMIDIEVRDPHFDPLFLVEAAPADVVRLVLDPDARAYLASQSQIELDTTVRFGSACLQLAIRGWIEDPREAIAAIDATTRIASRIRGAFAAVEAAQPIGDQGSPYRPMLDDTPARDAAEARSREVREVDALRARRGLM